MKHFKQSLKYGAVGSFLSLAAAAHATVPAEVTSAISEMKADGITVATAFLVAILAVAAIKFLRSAK